MDCGTKLKLSCKKDFGKIKKSVYSFDCDRLDPYPRLNFEPLRSLRSLRKSLREKRGHIFDGETDFYSTLSALKIFHISLFPGLKPGANNIGFFQDQENISHLIIPRVENPGLITSDSFRIKYGILSHNSCQWLTCTIRTCITCGNKSFTPHFSLFTRLL